jgi:hypothetical protein
MRRRFLFVGRFKVSLPAFSLRSWWYGALGLLSLIVLMGQLTFAQFKELPPYKSGEEPFAVVAADFSNRGILDLAVANFKSRNVAILQGNGDGTFSQHFKSGTASTSPGDVVAADFNRDGFVDVAVALDEVVVHAGNGDGTFQKQPLYSGNRTVPRHLVVADFNLDGIPDLATSSELTGVVQVLLGTGQGTFQAQTIYTNAYATRVMAADLNGDGYPDLAVSVFCNAQPLKQTCPSSIPITDKAPKLPAKVRENRQGAIVAEHPGLCRNWMP